MLTLENHRVRCYHRSLKEDGMSMVTSEEVGGEGWVGICRARFDDMKHEKVVLDWYGRLFEMGD